MSVERTAALSARPRGWSSSPQTIEAIVCVESAILSLLVQNLLKSAEDHFNYEEDIMTAINYQGVEKHCDAHQRLLCSARLIAGSLLTNDEITDADNIGRFFIEWLVDHIEGEDTLLSEYMTELDRKGLLEKVME